MTFGVFQRSKSYRQLWRRPATYTPAAGRGAASLVLGEDATDATATLQAGDRIEIGTSGDVNDTKVLAARGTVRLNEAPPEGYGWRVGFTVDGYTHTIDYTETEYGAESFPRTYSLGDIALNVAGLGAAVDISWSLELIEDPDNAGGTGVDVDVVLPSVFIDQLLAPETVASDLYVSERLPAPGATGVPVTYPTIAFRLSDVSGAGVDLANTTITVDGVTAYTAGAFVAPWTGTTTGGTGPTSNDVDVELVVPAANLPYDSEETMEVNVVSQLVGPASAIDTTWVFTAADVIPPAVQTARMLNKTTLRVTFTDDVLLDTSAHGALNSALYSIVRNSAPAVALSVVSVAPVQAKTDTVDLIFDVEASQGASYAVQVTDVKDTSGNILDPAGRETRFTGYTPPRPAGRRFYLLDFLPDMNISDDRTAAEGNEPTETGTGDLEKFVLVLQDVVDLLLCMVDEWTKIIDIDLAPEPFLDAILQDLGNPFAACIADLTLVEKRRLARLLISIYKQKGTAPGIINAIRFFTGIEVDLDILNDRPYWQLNISQLGVNTSLAPPVGSPLWYSFFIVSPVVLTDDQRERILCIADYMKPAHEHILGIIEPNNVITPSDYWVLNQSLLGATSAPSTTLA